MAYRNFPYANIHNPTNYSALMRGVRGGETPAALRRYSRKWIGIILGLSVALALFLLGLAQWVDPALLSFFAMGVYLLALMALLAAPVVDVFAALYAASAIANDHATGRFDLMLVSTMNSGEYIARHLALVRVRTWRVLIVVLGLRAGVLAMLLTFAITRAVYALATVQWALVDVQTVLANIFDFYALIGVAAAAVIVVFIGAIWLCEPLWQFRAITALAVAAGVTVRNPTLVGTMGRTMWRWLGVRVICLIVLVVGLFMAAWMYYVFFIPLLGIPAVLFVFQQHIAKFHEHRAVHGAFTIPID